MSIYQSPECGVDFSGRASRFTVAVAVAVAVAVNFLKTRKPRSGEKPRSKPRSKPRWVDRGLLRGFGRGPR